MNINSVFVPCVSILMLTLYPKISPFGSWGATQVTTTAVALMTMILGADKPTGSKNIHTTVVVSLTVHVQLTCF